MCFRMLLALALASPLIVAGQSNPPGTRTRLLSLDESIEMALSRNLDLQIQRAYTDIARFDLNGSYGVYSPLLSFSATRDFVSQPGDFDPKKNGADAPYDLWTETAGPSLTGKIPFGLTYGITAEAGRKDARTDFSGTSTAILYPPDGIRRTNNFFASTGVSLRQHLLRDSWIDQDRELILVRRKDVKISEQALKFDTMKTVLAVELAYYDLAAAREQVRVQEKALELRKQFVAETRRRVEVGDLPPLDSDQAETQFENTLTALSVAREALWTRQNAFKVLITDNFMEWVDLEPSPLDSLSAMKVEVNRSESFRRAMSGRPDLLQARLAVERSDVTVRFRKNQLFPSVDILGRYGSFEIEEGANSAISQAARFHDPDYSYGVVMSFPLANIKERNDYRASKANRYIAGLQLQKAEQEVLLQVADFVNRVESRFSQVESTRKARTYAEGALAAEEKKLQNGLSTTFVVLQLQETLTAARTAEIAALVDYNRALAQLAFAEGSTLEKHRMKVAP
jgi:outer membrane protein TolC